jgi:hypothetical protein
MSNTTLYDVRADGKALVMVTGSISDSAVVSGIGFTMTDEASPAGTYTITFDDQYNALISCVVSLEHSDATYANGWTAQVSGYTTGANPTIKFVSYDETFALNDLTSGTNIHFIAIFRDTVVAT